MDGFSDLTIIIPTINEAGNIGRLLRLVLGRYRGVHVIVSDDGSTDSTRKEVEAISRRYGRRVKFLDRKARVHGLTASVIDAAVLANTKNIIVMDGDMQHPFEKVGSMHSALNKSDIVICVRGRVKDWGLQRRIISACISCLAYSIFLIRGKPTCSDMMSGFFGIRSSIIKKMVARHKNRFVPHGYKILLDILKLTDRRTRIAEIRYNTFNARKRGKSKLSGLGINHAGDTLKSIFS